MRATIPTNNRNPNPINATTLIVGGIVVAAGVLLAAVIASFAISQSAPAPAAPAAPATATATAAQPVVVTRQVEVAIAAATLTSQPTFTPWPTFTPYPTPTPAPTATPSPTPTPLPIPEWKGMGSLASIEFTDSVVVERERERPGIGGVLLGNDRVVLMAVGRVVMGVDLGKITRKDVKIEGTKITVRVPRASVIAVELLPDKSRIFDSQRSWLFSQYEGLEVEALDEARAKLQANARANAGMHELAENMARLQLSELLRKAGYTDVVIEFAD